MHQTLQAECSRERAFGEAPSAKILNQASHAGSNGSITINTGPVTSHTVMLNLFPTSTTSAKPASHEQKKLQQ